MLSLINFETRNFKLFEYVRKVGNSQIGFLSTQKQVCDTYLMNGMPCVWKTTSNTWVFDVSLPNLDFM